MASVSLKNVSKNFGDVVALRNVNLDIRQGEFLVLFGPSGAGKTTTLRLIAGIEKPSSGYILFDGARKDHVPAHKRGTAMVFESYALYPTMTVRENMLNPLRSKVIDMPKAEAEERVVRVATMLKMQKYLDRYPRELSGGQKQRVSIGRAMVREPEIFLLDEPLSHVDAKIREEMRRELHLLRSTLRSAVVYVTHDYVEALSLGDRVAIINEGEILQVGTPYEVYYSPANVFVASHVGWPEMNLFDAVLQADGNDVVLRFTEVELEYRMPGKAYADLGDDPVEVIAGVRPQYIDYDAAEMDAPGFLSEVVSCEDFKTQVNVIARSGEKWFTCIHDPDRCFNEGASMHVSFDPKRVHLFDKASGTRLIPATSAAETV